VLYKAIQEEEPFFPEILTPDAKDLLEKLLQKDPEKRLGYRNGAKEVMDHPFFNVIDFGKLIVKQL